jgi:hypothetical protein
MFDFYREMNKVFDSIGRLPNVDKNGVRKKSWQAKSNDNGAIDLAKVEYLVGELRHSLEEGAFDAKDQLSELIEALKGQHMELTGNMTDLVNEYEFIQAQSILDKLATELTG